MKNCPKHSCVLLGNYAIGNTWKLGSGRLREGPATRPKATLQERFLVTILGWEIAEGRLPENLDTFIPVKPMGAPYLRLLHKRETNFWSG